jgi:proline dehydrogenase
MTNEMNRNDNTQRISIEQYYKEIDEAIARIDNGEFYTQEEVEKKLIKAESRGFTDKNKNEILAISKRLIKNK